MYEAQVYLRNIYIPIINCLFLQIEDLRMFQNDLYLSISLNAIEL